MNAIGRQALSNDLLRFGVNHQMQLSPSSAFRFAVHPYFPTALTLDLQAEATFEPGKANEDAHRDPFVSVIKRRMFLRRADRVPMTAFAVNFVTMAMGSGIIEDRFDSFLRHHSENERGKDHEKSIRFPRRTADHAMIIAHVTCLSTAEYDDDACDGFPTATENDTNKQLDNACERRLRKSDREGKQYRLNIFVRLHETDSFPLFSMLS